LTVTVINVLGSFILIGCGLIVVITLFLYPTTTIIGRAPLLLFEKALAPVHVIGINTLSSSADLPATCADTSAGHL